jgi:rhamnose transport system ATP-binding protein
LLGENRAGKSTFVKVMTGVHQPDKGEYIWMENRLFCGYRIAPDGDCRNISELFPDLDVAENILWEDSQPQVVDGSTGANC